jgi:hypothetical protein
VKLQRGDLLAGDVVQLAGDAAALSSWARSN